MSVLCRCQAVHASALTYHNGMTCCLADFHSLPAPDLDEWRSSFIEFINQVTATPQSFCFMNQLHIVSQHAADFVHPQCLMPSDVVKNAHSTAFQILVQISVHTVLMTGCYSSQHHLHAMWPDHLGS